MGARATWHLFDPPTTEMQQQIDVVPSDLIDTDCTHGPSCN